MNEIRQEVAESRRVCEQNASEFHDRLRHRYLTNQQRKEQFDFAFRNATDYYSNKRWNSTIRANISENQSRIEELILAIIPPKPDLERIKRDLIGREIRNQTRGYPNFRISSLDELKEVEIVSVNKDGDNYFFNVNLLLQGVANQWNANTKIRYGLRHYNTFREFVGYSDDWTINSFEGTMNIVRTGKFDNCIKTERSSYESGGWVNRRSFISIRFINQCEEDLLVIGVASGTNPHYPLLRNIVNESNFAVVVRGNSTSEFRGGGSGDPRYNWNVTNYEIHFIERAEL